MRIVVPLPGRLPATVFGSLGAGLGLVWVLAGCADHDHQVVISVPEQRMVVLNRGVPVGIYPVSTSKFGLGDAPGRGNTPLGALEIAQKIGDGAPLGAVLKSRRQTGEIVGVDAPGRDAIVTRILWLRGLEPGNQNTHERLIYIHGTPEERNIGRPVSYGCIRMRSRDIVQVFDTVGEGARVFIENESLPNAARPLLAAGSSVAPVPDTPAVPPTPVTPGTLRLRVARQPGTGARTSNGSRQTANLTLVQKGRDASPRRPKLSG